jgi:hypothetical protein
VLNRGRQNPIYPKPDETFRELVQRKQQRKRSKQQLPAMLHMQQGRYAQSTKDSAPYKVRRRRKHMLV